MDVDLTDPMHLWGIYQCLAEQLVEDQERLTPLPPGLDRDSVKAQLAERIKQQHEAGLFTIEADGDTWRVVDVAKRH